MYLRYVNRTIENSDFIPHNHNNNSEILYVTNGVGKVEVNGELTELYEGDIIFCPRGTVHTGPGGNCGVIYIIADIPIPEGMNQHFIVHDDEKQTARSFFESIYDIYNRPDNETAYKNIEKALCDLIFELSFSIKRKNDQSKEVNALYEAIMYNFSDSTFELGREMEKISHSVTYLRRCFKESMGMSPNKYLNLVRINHAKKLIAKRIENNISISSIAYSCGFADDRYFFRVFKEYTGITPLKYFEKYC